MPASDFPKFLASLNDKVIHGIEYFLLFWIAWNAFRQASWHRYGAKAALVYCTAMGLLTEFLQMNAPTRSPGWDDFGADLLGAGLAFLLLFLKNRTVSSERS